MAESKEIVRVKVVPLDVLFGTPRITADILKKLPKILRPVIAKFRSSSQCNLSNKCTSSISADGFSIETGVSSFFNGNDNK